MRAKIFDQTEERQRLIRKRCEAEVLVEAARIFVFRVDRDRAYAGDVYDLEDAPDGIEEQGGAEPLALPTAISREAREEGDRDRMARQAFAQPLRGVAVHYTAHDQRIVADAFIDDGDEGLSGARALALQRMKLEVAIQRLRAAVEGGRRMMAVARALTTTATPSRPSSSRTTPTSFAVPGLFVQ